MYALHRLAVRCLSTRGRVRRMYSDQNVVVSPFPDVDVPSTMLPEFVWRGLPAWQDKICMECSLTGRRYTFAQSRDAARRFAVSLQRMRMEPGDVLAVVLPNIPEFGIVTLGAVEAGLTLTTVNPNYTPGEINKQLVSSGARCVITDVERYRTVQQAVAQIEKLHVPIIVAGSSTIPDKAVNFHRLVDGSVDISTPLKASPSSSPDDVVIIPYSSGTTGLPKGVMLTHRNLVANMMQLHASDIDLSVPTSDSYQDVVPGLLPFYHIYGLTVILLDKIALGSKLVTLPKFEPATFLNSISKHKASLLFLAPPLVLFLAGHPEVGPQLLESVRHIMSGAAPLGASDLDRLLAKSPPRMGVSQGYGMTETSPVIMHSRKASTNKAAVGPPIPNTCGKVLDLETGAALGPGQVGEVCCRGPQVMKGYLNNPEATSAMIDEDGWLHTGDIGYYDEKLDFYITDRLKELIKVKGLQVAPAELEELLRSHPQVTDAAVIGVPDERAGQVPRAVIVPKKPGSLTEQEVKQFVAERVSDHKHLAGGVVFVESIPKSAAGKILRRQLVGI
ncbi:uncharacterized protein [Anabrus simplex]